MRHADPGQRHVSRMTAAGLVPVTLELLDRYVIRAVEAALHLGLDAAAGAMLLIESDAGGALAEAELETAAGACRAAGSTSQERATDPEEADALCEARRPGALVDGPGGRGPNRGHRRPSQPRRRTHGRHRAGERA